MNLNNMFPVFRFASLRNAKPAGTPPTPLINVMPATTFINSLIALNEGSTTNAQKLASGNTLLQNFIASASFIKSKTDFATKINTQTPSTASLNQMYDNIVVRLITKSNTNEVYALLVKYVKSFAASLNATTVDKIRIILPERITLTYAEFAGVNAPAVVDPAPAQLLIDINDMTDLKKLIRKAKAEDVLTFDSVSQYTRRNIKYQPILLAAGKDTVSAADATSVINTRSTNADTRATATKTFPQTDASLAGSSTLRAAENNNVSKALNDFEHAQQLRKLLTDAIAEGVSTFSNKEVVPDTAYGQVVSKTNLKTPIPVDVAEKYIDEQLAGLYKKLHKVLPGTTYAMIGGTWRDVTPIANGEVVTDETGTNILVHTHECVLKYPVLVADLRVIEQQTVGYLPAEIAHISNTQRGEINTRVTRRLKKVETTETLINESELTRETDTQTAERFSIENDATQVQQEESSWNVNATASYAMGPISASVSGGYSSSSLATSSNSTAQTYAKDILTRIVDRVSNRTRLERSVKTVEEFEETVTHMVDNSVGETKSYVYRWLNKLVRGTLKNYGKRLIFEVNIAHPAHYYLSRSIKDQPKLNIPEDPRSFKLNGVAFNPEMIDRTNYISWGSLYNVKLEAPPQERIIISEALSGSSDPIFVNKLIPIKKDYQCKKAVVTNTYPNGWPGGNALAYMIGNAVMAHWSGTDDFWTPRVMYLANETENLPVSIFERHQGYIMNIEVHCELSTEAFNAWQLQAYYAIIDGYELMKTQAEAKVNDFDINAPGLAPEKKRELIKTELKKEAIRKLHRCNPFWVDDKYQVGIEHNPDCCKDGSFAERVRFIETVFDWQNMTYELFPYFYNNKSQWNRLLELTDDDPHFESFMRSSFATIRIPVFRDQLKEIAACNFVVNNAIGNFETIPEGLADLLGDLADEPASLFTYDLDGNALPVPKSTVDLGIFPIPTGLVMLECGTEDGVKPIGFPQTAPLTTDVSIPKQYSPAIIADVCPTTP